MRDENRPDEELVQFFLTPKHPCSYLSRNNAQTLFFDPRQIITTDTYQILTDQGFRLLRTPVNGDELAISLLAAAVNLRSGDTASAPGPAPEPIPRRSMPTPPRRYSDSALLRLGAIDSAVDCECPRHMAEVVRTLAGFESYSAQCEDRNEEDAALHARLHQSSAQARAIMEEALEHLVKVEGIEL